MSNFTDAIQRQLFQNAELDYIAFQKKICPNTGKMIGVRLPVLRKMAKEMAKGKGWKNFLSEPAVYYEEIMLQGFLIGYIDCSLEERLFLLADFIPKIKNWGICDSVCNTLKIAQKYPQEFWEFLLPYLNSSEEFEVRFALVMLLNHFVKYEVWYIRVANAVSRVRHPGYYVKMAAAWTMAEVFLQYPESMRDTISDFHLDPETRKMMIRKLLDSHRLLPEDRERIQQGLLKEKKIANGKEREEVK